MESSSAMGLSWAVPSIFGCIAWYGTVAISGASCEALSALSSTSSDGGGATLCSMAMVVTMCDASSLYEMYQNGVQMVMTFQPSWRSITGRTYSRSSTDSRKRSVVQSSSMTARMRFALFASMTIGPTGMPLPAKQGSTFTFSFCSSSMTCGRRAESAMCASDVLGVDFFARKASQSRNSPGFALACMSISCLVVNTCIS